MNIFKNTEFPEKRGRRVGCVRKELPGFEEATPDEGFLISYSQLMMGFTVSRHHLSLYNACRSLRFHNQLAFSSIIHQQREQNASEA